MLETRQTTVEFPDITENVRSSVQHSLQPVCYGLHAAPRRRLRCSSLPATTRKCGRVSQLTRSPVNAGRPVDPKATVVSRPKAAVERAKPQAATKFLSHAGENVSHKWRKPAQLKAFSFTDYQLITKLMSIMDNIALLQYLTPLTLISTPCGIY